MEPELVDLMVKARGWDAFENLVFALVRADEPTARQLRPPDGGRDTIVPANEDHGELVWQAKRYTTRIYWDKCEKSLNKALEKRSPEEFTFVFAVNLSENDEDKLAELRKKYSARPAKRGQQISVGLSQRLAGASEDRVRRPRANSRGKQLLAELNHIHGERRGFGCRASRRPPESADRKHSERYAGAARPGGGARNPGSTLDSTGAR
jgi:hypothetical protein